MSIFEGRTRSERIKIIAAIVLGGLALISLVYTFGGLFWPVGKSTTASIESTAPGPEISGAQPAETPGTDRSTDERISNEYQITPLNYAGGGFSAPSTGRNIFAFYEPPPGTPTPEVPEVTITPATPTPEAPMLLSFVRPGTIYAGSKQFRIEAVGERFVSGSRILFNGSPLLTSFIDERRLTAFVPARMVARSGSGSVYVNTPDGKLFSYPVPFTIVEPPKPDFEYIGLIARRHFNNDTAYFRDKGRPNAEPFTARLNDVVKARFRVVSISSEEVEFEDVRLGFRHKIPLLRPDTTSTRGSSVPRNNTFNRGRTRRSIPGIPDNVPRSTPRVRTINPIPGSPNRPANNRRNVPKNKKDDNNR